MKQCHLNVEKIPVELKRKKQWMPFKFLPDSEGRMRKPPCSIETQKPADAMNPDKWYTLDDCIDALADAPGVFAGVGYVFNGEEFGIDFDHVIEDGKINSEVEQVIKEIGSYTEYSPSGAGVHIICKGVLAENLVCKEKSVEWYNRKRFFTFTGNVLSGYETLTQGKQVDKWYSYHQAIKNKKIQPDVPVSDFRSSEAKPQEVQTQEIQLVTGGDCERVIELFTDHPKGDDLWNGDYRNKKLSPSEYDWAITKIGIQQRLTDSEIIYLMLKWRERLGEGTEKVTDKDYRYARLTINNARDQSPPDEIAEPIQIREKVTSLSASEFMATYERVGWRIKGYVPTQGLIWIAGKWSSNKTFFVLGMCYAMATGRAFYNIKTKKSNVSFIVGEGRNQFILRMIGLAQHYKEPFPDDTFLVTPMPIEINNEQYVNRLILSYVERDFNPDVIVIDTKSANMSGNDSDAATMNEFINQCRRLERMFNAVIIIVDHVGYQDSTRPRGASQQLGAADGVYMCEWDDETTTGRFSTLKDPKDSGKPDEIFFKRHVVDVDGYLDEDGEQLTTLILEHYSPQKLVTPDHSLYPELITLADDRVRAFEILYGLYIKHANTLSIRENGIPRVEMTVWRDELVIQKVIKSTTANDIRTAFHNIKKVLLKAGIVEIEGSCFTPVLRGFED